MKKNFERKFISLPVSNSSIPAPALTFIFFYWAVTPIDQEKTAVSPAHLKRQQKQWLSELAYAKANTPWMRLYGDFEMVWLHSLSSRAISSFITSVAEHASLVSRQMVAWNKVAFSKLLAWCSKRYYLTHNVFMSQYFSRWYLSSTQFFLNFKVTNCYMSAS